MYVIQLEGCRLCNTTVTGADLDAPGLQILLRQSQTVIPLASCILICPATA